MESCGVDSPYLPQNSDPNNHAQIPLSLSSVDEESGSPSNLIPFNLSKDQVGKPLKCFSGNIWSRRLMNPQLSICKDMTECVVNCNVNTKSGQRNEGMWFLASKDKKQTTSPWRNTHTHTHTHNPLVNFLTWNVVWILGRDLFPSLPLSQVTGATWRGTL